MKKSLTSVTIVFIVCTIITNYNICKNRKEEPISSKQVIKRDLLSYYKEDDSGNYVLSTSNEWPTDGYLFNAELSRCENGSILKWDNETNTVVISSSVSDKCYIYFDKYVLSEITSVTISNVTDSSITVTVASNEGTSSISKYYYSISTNSTTTNYIENTSNIYTFNSLEDGTTYYIKIYALDAKNKITNTYDLSQKTSESKPIILNISGLPSYATNDLECEIIISSKEELSAVYMSEKNRNKWYKGRLISDNKYYFSDIWLCDQGTYFLKIYAETISGIQSDIFEYSWNYTCFTSGTKIYTLDGYKNIEDIKANDKVYSYNENSKKVEINKVNKTFIHEDTEVFKIYIDGDIINVTPHHRFYTYRNGKYSWITAKDLITTDKLVDNQNKHISILKIEYLKENNKVYNFEVENNHNYYVSKNKILVHNAKGC